MYKHAYFCYFISKSSNEHNTVLAGRDCIKSATLHTQSRGYMQRTKLHTQDRAMYKGKVTKGHLCKE